MLIFLLVLIIIVLIVVDAKVIGTEVLPFMFSVTLVSMLLGAILVDQESVRKSNHKGYEIETIYKVKNGKKIGVTYHVKEKK
jgi:hypothetical protein